MTSIVIDPAVIGVASVGAYGVLNAVFIGLYGFSAVYHLLLWWQSRREAILLAFACRRP